MGRWVLRRRQRMVDSSGGEQEGLSAIAAERE